MGAQSARLDRIAYWERDMYSLLWHNTTEQHTHTPHIFIYIYPKIVLIYANHRLICEMDQTFSDGKYIL